MMTAVVLGPYEHIGAYIGSELFDTSGTAPDFCEHCEHAPCVAGGSPYCTLPPRFISVEAIKDEIDDLKWKVADYGHNMLWEPFRVAVHGLSVTGWTRSYAGDRAVEDLVRIRAALREAAQVQS